MYYCEKCKDEITDLTDALVLKIRNAQGNFVKGFILHKGECDETVSHHYQEQGMDSNATMNLGFLHERNAVEKYRVTGEFPEPKTE